MVTRVFIPNKLESIASEYISEYAPDRSKRLWHVNKFNIVASDKVALNRSVPDVRRATCRARDFRKGGALRLPSASVVIVFHNEAWSTLLRTVHSVINRSARRDLREVILVDDASNR